ncbi:MAG: hypothetical protein V1875_09515 [Candidatus Altiarchaeota archaeon]
MRLLTLLALVLLAGCLEPERVVVREYVCPDGRVVSAPEACGIKTTTTMAPPTTTVSSPATTSTTHAPTTTTLETCGGFKGDDRAECLAVTRKNASLCPVGGLEYNGNFLTESLFIALGRDVLGKVAQERAIEAFSKGETCVMEVIGLLFSKDDCITSPMSQLCEEKFIVGSDNATVCESYQQGSMQQGCYFALIRLNGNEQACMKYPEYGDCLVKAAAKYDDYRLCSRAYGESDKMLRCVQDAKYERCMSSTDGIDCCLNVSRERRGSCYIQKRKQTGDPFWCKDTDTSGRPKEDWDCYVKIALKAQNPEMCGGIGPRDKHDYCLKEMALGTGNFTVCDGVFDDRERRRCRYGLP